MLTEAQTSPAGPLGSFGRFQRSRRSIGAQAHGLVVPLMAGGQSLAAAHAIRIPVVDGAADLTAGNTLCIASCGREANHPLIEAK